MDEERRQRQVDFILDSLAQLAATANRLAQFQVEAVGRIAPRRLCTLFPVI